MTYCVPFEDCDRGMVPEIGGKNASLGEMLRAEVPVPPGFAVTTAFYEEFVETNGIDEHVAALAEAPSDDTAALGEFSEAVREAIRAAEIPDHLVEELRTEWSRLANRCDGDPRVAVRSSATAEDLPDTSFAGQHETHLNVRGDEELVERIRDAMASLFSHRAVVYREENGFDHEEVEMSVGVQEMVDARASGVMFTLNPANGDRSKVRIEANWGLGESVVSGSVTPDSFLLDKPTFQIVERNVSTKERMTVPTEAGVEEVAVDPDRRDRQCITDDEAAELATFGKRLERHYGTPQDVEWVVERGTGSIYLVQSRPETAWESAQSP